MKKPELVVTESGKGLRGKCSSCPESEFNVTVGEDTPDHRDYLRRTFALHFKTVHMREDAGQAAFRTVREATEKD